MWLLAFTIIKNQFVSCKCVYLQMKMNSKQKKFKLSIILFLFSTLWTNPAFFLLVSLGQTAFSWIRVGVLPKLWGVPCRVRILWYQAKCHKSVVLGDAHIFWHQKVLQKSSLQAMVDLVSVESSAFIFLLSPWLCSISHRGKKSVGRPFSAEQATVLRRTRSHPWNLRPPPQHLTTGWEGDPSGAQTGCTPHTKGLLGPDLHWEQNQGPAEVNPWPHYLSCTSLSFLVSLGWLTVLQKCVRKDAIIPYLSKPETGNTRKACLVQFPVQLCRLKKCR